MSNPILILLTGGTIDGIINPGEKPMNRKSAVKDYIDSLKLEGRYMFRFYCNKDSRDITVKDRKEILKIIQNTKAGKILVTHGTFTMAETGRFLKRNQYKFNHKTVILTGSMIPLKKWYPGDAPFNLGFALASLLKNLRGVHIAMNGCLFDPDHVVKNTEKLRFEKISKEVY